MGYSLRKAKEGRRFVRQPGSGRIIRVYPDTLSVSELLDVANKSLGFWKKLLERQRDLMFTGGKNAEQ